MPTPVPNAGKPERTPAPGSRVRRWLRHPLVLGAVGTTLCVAAGVYTVQAWLRPHPVQAAVAAPVIEVPIRPVDRHAPEDAERVIVTLRWGHTAADDRPVSAGDPARTSQWDGYLALDCGDIERVEPLGMETEPADGSGAPAAALEPGDRVGPVVRGDDGDQRVYWRSRTARDWDGVRATLAICRSDVADGASTLRVVTPQKTYVARLDWSVDDFVSLAAASDGNTLDVHMASTRDRKRVPNMRVTAKPAQDGQTSPLAAVEEAAATTEVH